MGSDMYSSADSMDLINGYYGNSSQQAVDPYGQMAYPLNPAYSSANINGSQEDLDITNNEDVAEDGSYSHDSTLMMFGSQLDQIEKDLKSTPKIEPKPQPLPIPANNIHMPSSYKNDSQTAPLHTNPHVPFPMPDSYKNNTDVKATNAPFPIPDVYKTDVNHNMSMMNPNMNMMNQNMNMMNQTTANANSTPGTFLIPGQTQNATPQAPKPYTPQRHSFPTPRRVHLYTM